MPSSHSNWPARILCGVVLAVVSCIFLPTCARTGDIEHKSVCSSNLKQLGLGMIQYAQDYNEKLPPVAIAVDGSAYGWAFVIFPYTKTNSIYFCPQISHAPQPTPAQNRFAGSLNPLLTGYTDYPFNKRMDGKLLEKINRPADQVLLLDGNYTGDVTDARYSISQIPTKWRENTDSPLYRHNGRANYLFTDGHVKALSPSQVQDANSFVF
ncbi:hypothetical protein IAD21_03576 [Abditibacteriota bacterium]|nr:hypothetical protein IAD21_03576 [Abditibacteriota bacterium]